MLFNDKLVEFVGKKVEVMTVHGHADAGVVESCGHDFIEFVPDDGTAKYLVRSDAIFGICLAS